METSRIFISYAKRDRYLAEKFKIALQADSYFVWIDEHRSGDKWPRENALAVVKSDVICLLWTRNSPGSRWTEHEWFTARALKKRVLPCTFPGAPSLPKPIARVFSINCQDADTGVEKLLENLKYVSGFTNQYNFKDLPLNNLPWDLPGSFIGRDMDLVETYLMLQEKEDKVNICPVSEKQTNGIGKTCFAIGFAHHFSPAYKGIFWIDGANVDNWISQWVTLAKDVLGLKIVEPDRSDSDKQYLLKLKGYFQAHPDSLVMIDNIGSASILEDPKLMNGIMPLNFACRFLLISDIPLFALGIMNYDLDCFSPVTSYIILNDARKPITSSEETYLNKISRRLGCFPLALSLVKGYLQQYTDVTYKELNNRLETAGEYSQVIENTVESRVWVFVILSLHWKMLDACARKCLILMACFEANANIPQERLKFIACATITEFSETGAWEKMLLGLARLNLCQLGQKDKAVVTLHSEVRTFLKNQCDIDWEKEKIDIAQNIKAAYENPKMLVCQLVKCGVKQVLIDLDLAIKWGHKETDFWQPLNFLRRFLNHQQYFLAEILRKGEDVFLWQQLSAGAAQLGFKDWIHRFYSGGLNIDGIMLKTLFVNQYADISQVYILKGHESKVNAVAVTKNGKYAISGANDKNILTWDMANGRLRQVFSGKQGRVNALCLDETHDIIISGHSDGAICTWKMESGKLLNRFQAHDYGVNVLCLNKKHQLLSGGEDRGIVLWDLNSGKALCRLKAHKGAVKTLDISADGKFAVSGGEDGLLIFWDLEKKLPFQEINMRSGWVEAAGITPNMHLVLSGASTPLLTLWSLQSGERVQTFSGHSYAITAIAIDSNNRYALTGSADHTLKLWDIGTGEVIRTFNGHAGVVRDVSMSQNGDLAASTSDDHSVRIWDTTLRPSFPGTIYHRGAVTIVAISNDGKVAASYSPANRTLVFREVDTGDVLRVIKNDLGAISAIALLPDGKKALCGYSNGVVVLLDRKNGKPIRSYQAHEGEVRAICVDEEGIHAVSGAHDRRLRFWDIQKGALKIELNQNQGWIESACMSRDAAKLLSFESQGDTVLWDLPAEKELQRYSYPFAMAQMVQLMPDGKHIVQVENQTLLTIRSTESHAVVQQIETGSRHIELICPANDGHMVISYNDRKELMVWDVQSGKICQQIMLPNSLRAIATAGKRIVAGDEKATVYFWEIVD